MLKTKNKKLFSKYISTYDGLTCYSAGLPGYPSNFSRDTLISGIISSDQYLLESQLLMSLKHQGQKYDPITGEEPGKIHHEFPGVMVSPPYLSTYNACDTTALYLIGLEALWHFNNNHSEELSDSYQKSIESAVTYIKRHIKEDIFWDFPPPPAYHYSLRVTYWKDSCLPDASGRIEPTYPVAYGLVQFQVARALLSASLLLNRPKLRELADKLFKKGIETFMSESSYRVEQDHSNKLDQISSDELQALAYIPKQYAPLMPLSAISQRAEELTTTVGIASTPKEISRKLLNQYHGYVVWIFEQALINYGCLKFDLNEVANVAQRCRPYIGNGQELILIESTIKPIGNSNQLWSVAAKAYFTDRATQRNLNWL